MEKKKLIIIFERANMEPIQVENGKYEFLNCDEHISHIRRLRKDPAFCRPDIIHQCLLTLSKSPLNRSGHLQIYVKTDMNMLIKLDPQLAIPHSFDEFTRVFMKVIKEVKPIRAIGSSKQLAKLVRNPITSHLPVGCVKYALSSKAKDLVAPSQLVPDHEDNVVLVIGAMAHEQLAPDYVDQTFAISQYPLSAALVCAKVTVAFEARWNIGGVIEVPLSNESIISNTIEECNQISDTGHHDDVHNSTTKKPKVQNIVQVKSDEKDLLVGIHEARNREPDVWFDGVDKKLIEMHCSQQNLVTATNDHLTTNNDRTSLTKELAIDCEMVECFHNKSVLARVSIVNLYGHPVYDKYVEPPSKVTDYRTPYSGIRRQDLINAPTFDEVQAEVREMLRGRIVIGHALHNDFGVLKLSHPKCDIRDTSRHFKTYFQGKTPSLKKLSQCLLGLRVQEGEHDSIQDAQVAMRLYRDKWTKSPSVKLTKCKKVKKAKRVKKSLLCS